MRGIDEIQDDFIRAFCEIDDWLLQYEFLLQIAAELPIYPDEKRKDQYLIRGCQSRLWIACEIRDDRIHLWADSEALIVKGIVAVFAVMFQDQPLGEVASANVRYISETGLKDQISTDRFHGISSAIASVQNFAAGYIR